MSKKTWNLLIFQFKMSLNKFCLIKRNIQLIYLNKNDVNRQIGIKLVINKYKGGQKKSVIIDYHTLF